MFNWKLLLFVALISYGAYQSYSKRAVTHTNGVIAALQPVQQLANQSEFNFNGYTITPLQSFQIEARVLATKSYSLDHEADLSPIDFALGWGSMSDEAILSKVEISQSNRFYYWHVDEFPIPRRDIETQSANMHMIPADKQIEKTLKAVRPGQVVKFSGYLIEAKAKDGWYWKSSLTRDDTGKGACEVVFVKAISVS